VEHACDAGEECIRNSSYQKSLQGIAVSWFRKIHTDLDIVLEGGDTGGRDAGAQDIQLGNGKDKLFQVEGWPLAARMANSGSSVALWIC
jgi:hypothetical protein